MSKTPHAGRLGWPYAVAWALVAACGQDVRLGDGRTHAAPAPDAGEDGPDGGRSRDDDAGGPDSGAEGPVPRFTEPVRIEALVGDDDIPDDDPSLTADLTLIFFNSRRGGGSGREDIWFAHRPDADADFGTPEPATTLNSEARETGVALSADGLHIYWSSDRNGGAGGLDIYRASRDAVDAPWSTPQWLEELNTGDDELVSAVADGGRRLLLARRPDDGDYSLWWASRAGPDDPWSAPVPIEQLDGGERGSDPFLLPDGKRLLFSRGGDIQLATRTGLDAPFGAAVPLSTLNSDATDSDAWASAGLSRVFFASTRDGDTSRLYEARLAP